MVTGHLIPTFQKVCYWFKQYERFDQIPFSWFLLILGPICRVLTLNGATLIYEELFSLFYLFRVLSYSFVSRLLPSDKAPLFILFWTWPCECYFIQYFKTHISIYTLTIYFLISCISFLIVSVNYIYFFWSYLSLFSTRWEKKTADLSFIVTFCYKILIVKCTDM